MIEEQFVSFDTARLLKEAGFNAPCYAQYSEKGVQWDASYPDNFNADEFGYSCPTQALAARWLREAHNLHVFACIEYPTGTWFYCIADTTAPCAREGMNMPEANHDTHEGAMEAGIQEAIKFIKQQDNERI